MKALCDFSATTLRRMIGTKEISPVELLASCIDRIEKCNKPLNAIVAKNYVKARKESKRAEKAVLAGEDLGLLHGLPIGIKDLEVTKDLKTTFGSCLYKKNIPRSDQRTISSIRSSGGVVVAKTNTPEFGAGANTTNLVYGATGNPFNPDLTCGGSSGGSAVALATGMVPLATGSDYGGSLRIPAGFCGVVGFRPSPGFVPDETRTVGLSPYSVLGPMGRTVDDAILLLGAMIGYDRRDPFSGLRENSISGPLPVVDLSKLRVAFSEDLGVASVDNSIRKIFRERVKSFKHVFAKMEYRDPKFDQDLHEAFEIIRAVNFEAQHGKLLRRYRRYLGENVIANTELCQKYSASDVAWANRQQTIYYKNFLRLMDRFDVLISPTNSVSPFPHKKLFVEKINGKTLPSYMRWLSPTYVLTMVLPPACSIPCGRDHKNMPFGIQISAARGSDWFILSVAKALEKVFSGDEKTVRAIPEISKLQEKK